MNAVCRRQRTALTFLGYLYSPIIIQRLTILGPGNSATRGEPAKAWQALI